MGAWSIILNIIIGIISFIVVVLIVLSFFASLYNYISDVRSDGGLINHYREEKRRKAKRNEERKKLEEYERIKKAYEEGALTADELPRVEDGITKFEFKEEMGISVEYFANTRQIIYIEKDYSESINNFFINHSDFQLYEMYKFVYLPNLCNEIGKPDMLSYLRPDVKLDSEISKLDSSYPLKFLWYPDDIKMIHHGMIFFIKKNNKYGQSYILGHYFPIEDGSEESIKARLDEIVKEVDKYYSNGGLSCKIRDPRLKEGESDDYAESLFWSVVYDNELAGIVDEIRERLVKLREFGIADKVLLKLLKESPKLSRLVITKDFRLLLPDYNNMEIKMEPINKAVFLLFIKHPEGILFKHLPEYRSELTQIYEKLRPSGLTDRALQSIEDVTNPLLNSINEKCARIRGSFVSKFDETLARHYYIWGMRGEAKKINLPRNLVVWEE